MREKAAIALFLLISLIANFSSPLYSQPSDSTRVSDRDPAITIEHTEIIIRNISHEITLSFKDPALRKQYEGKQVDIGVNDSVRSVKVVRGRATFEKKFDREGKLVITHGDYTYRTHVDPIPLWFSIIPPLVAILFALIFKEV